MTTAIVTIVIFLVMISLHEFGHFIFGKLLGFRVLEYAIGFGPAIFKKQKGETLYSLKIIPFGGYCRFEGEDEEDSNDPGAFNNQRPWKRIIVLAAGAVFNVILGLMIYMILVWNSSPVYTNYVDTVSENSYAVEAGIQPGDKIMKLNGKKINFYRDIQLYTDGLRADEPIEILVKHENGEKEVLSLRLTTELTELRYEEDGIQYYCTINGQTETQWIPYSDEIPKKEEKIGTAETGQRYLIGFRPRMEEITIGNIFPQSWNMTKFVVKLVYKSLWDLVTGQIGMEQMSGPVGIVREVNTAVHAGNDSWMRILDLAALLTINLGVFNLLPLPALDGGRLLFVLIELIFRRPVPRDKEGMIHAVGFILLMGLMLFVSFHDIMKLFQ